MASKPWEKYGKAKVGPAPTAEQGGVGAVPASTPMPEGAPSEQPTTVATEVATAPPGTPPWDKYRNAVVKMMPEEDAAHIADLADTTERELNRIKYTAPDAGTVGGWINRAARATTFGASDYISSKIIGKQLREQDPSITDAEVLAAMREGFQEDVSMTAEIAGALAPGTAIARGGAVVMGAASRAGVLKGAINWLGKDKLFNRVVGAAGGGAAVGGTYEAIRESVDQAVGSVAGEQINPEEIWDAGVQGAVVGAVLGPVANEALRGAGGLVQWAKQAFGGNDATTMSASKRIIGTLAKEGETPDATVLRIRADAENFVKENGRPPALFEIIAPDKAAEIADVARYYSGLSPRMRNLTDQQVDEAVNTMLKASAGGKPLKDTEVTQGFIRDAFNSVMRRHGDEMVDVGDEAMDALSRNRAFLETQAKSNPEARQLLKIVKAKEDMASLSTKAARLSSSRDIAKEQSGIADLKRELADLIDEMKQAAETDPSEIERLRALIQMESAITNQFDKAVKAGWAEANANNALRTLQTAQRVLQDYNREGAKISLRTANAMRTNASKAANNPNDPNFQAAAQAVRDAIAPVGTKEVGQYGRVVKLWNTESTRAEAAATGKAAVTGKVSPENLAERIRASRLPGKAAGSPTATKKGIEEGARIELRNTARQGQDAAISRAQKITDSKLTQENIGMAIPGEGGKKIVSAADQLTKTDAGRRAVNSKMSPTELAEQVAGVKDDVMAAVIGNVGGAGFAGFVSRNFMKMMIPRKTADKLVDMLGDPKKVDDALLYLGKRGIPPKHVLTIMTNAQINADRQMNEGNKKKAQR